MPVSPLSVVLQHLLADLRPDGGGRTDGELLARFLTSRDDNALATVVRRHAPMVWGVCCRLLHNHHDAEDAFQATFLVLVRRAADVPGQAVAGWLHGVARQTAVRLRATRALRGRRETQVVNMPEPTVAEVHDADWHFVLDEELCRLPHHYRSVIVLCDLEGMTRKEAARQLGIPEGSLASRLARARVMLAKRLTRRGVVFSAGSVAAGSASASAPPDLVASTIKAASLFAAGPAATAEMVSSEVAALTEGVLKTMFLSKLRVVVGALMLVLVLVGGGVAISLGQPSESPKPKKADPESNQANAKEEATKAMLKRLEGTWELVSVHANGERTPTAVVFVRIKGDKWEFTTREGKVIDTSTVKLVDLDASPKRIDSIEDKDVPGRNDRTLNGIFMLDGDSLIVCFGAVARPKGFFTERGDGCIATQFERDHAR